MFILNGMVSSIFLISEVGCKAKRIEDTTGPCNEHALTIARLHMAPSKSADALLPGRHNPTLALMHSNGRFRVLLKLGGFRNGALELPVTNGKFWVSLMLEDIFDLSLVTGAG